MIYIAVFIFFIFIFMLTYGVLTYLTGNKIAVEKRIKQLKDIHTVNEENTENKSFSERMLRPFYNSFSQFLLKATPSSKLEVFSKRLDRAGLLKNRTTEKWLYIKSMTVLCAGVTMGLLSFTIDTNILKAFTLAILMILCVNVFFNFYISRRIETRKYKILKDLPYSLDLITVSVEAGLSFDGAMARVVANISGELCDEFAKALKEIRMGIERKTALRNMSERCDVRELSMLVTSLIQADELGVSLGRVLRIESANLREHRKQAAREKAMKAPVKILFPLIFFIFPAIFVIILGPAVIRMIEVFSKR
ncbi:type II secretion system F family protein [Clostridium sp. SYSU_GA19001]|uniref:type II secretion system F family protein n=1 Tax=Clostridium caldaquaticum TaxID=2940653 RepID=UPI0020772209|nr:type II secretion system F family protein [Clostridium caldaquaticum]MCM8710235.1 type II secretion system F family protein [Clostridium caldaquaticum]